MAFGPGTAYSELVKLHSSLLDQAIQEHLEPGPSFHSLGNNSQEFEAGVTALLTGLAE